MDARGASPVHDWILKLDQKAQNKCFAKIERLQEQGHKLERPDAAYLENKIHELRVTSDRHKYRILYFFHKRTAVILCHAFLKKDKKVPKNELDMALSRMKKFEDNPGACTFGGSQDG